MKSSCEGNGGELLIGRPQRKKKKKARVPECVRGEVALTATGGF